ncbi:putative 50S ribosomal protein L18 [Magnetofaba australis IT-1]|uniref:Large ribosomal subunit protein uL18 n=1 Tax=Magnetofaba australis IT-1 TaxID=1434232 RepID=A0A1Y2K5S7_9PROT|nr:putative 50S ribosomal protein L18 [Magnetofaba australis IT-1]
MQSVRGDRLRLSIFRSTSHIYAQIINDIDGKTLCSASTLEKEVREQLAGKHGGNSAAAKLVGQRIAEKAKQADITSVVFDRGGFLYHGRTKALADAAREAGLEF